jgi:hypothetical protein
MEEVKRELEQLATQIAEGHIGTAEYWGGADVAISPSDHPTREGNFYPEPRRVVTASAAELSWLFFRLQDIFSPYYDSQTKIEFFGRLANAARRYQAKKQGVEIPGDLLLAVLHEAFAMAEEMEEESFRSFALALGNEIVDDYIDEAERHGFIGIEETRRFFSEKGIGS